MKADNFKKEKEPMTLSEEILIEILRNLEKIDFTLDRIRDEIEIIRMRK